MNMHNARFNTTVILAMIFGLAGHAHAASVNVNVPANLLWVDTAINLSAGDMVTITANGTWNWGFASADFGPDGEPGTGGSWDAFQNFDPNDKGRLIGYIGADPFQGHWGDGTFFPQTSGYLSIGSSAAFTASTSGECWLGFNDDAMTKNASDNFGEVTANVSVAPIPLPPAAWLFGSGLLGLIGIARRKT